jgi:hypothetical protein
MARESYSVRFKPGQTALGHRWLLCDGESEEIGRTKLTYDGAGKSVGRLLRVTGLSTNGTISATVFDEGGEEIVHLRSTPGKDKRVDVYGPDDEPIGGARRRDLALELLAPRTDTVVGSIERAEKDDMAFPILSPDGRRCAVLTKAQLVTSAPSIYNMVFLPDVASNQIAFQATMHLGFAASREYHLLVEERPAGTTLQQLIALTPLIAAYAY